MELNFNAFDFDPTQGGSICFPLADYKVEISKAEPMVVKDNPGAGYLALTLTVLEGELRGMTQVDRLNIFNPSEVAKRIAHQTLSAYAFAIGRPYLQHSEQLIGGRLIVTIGPQTDNPKYSEVRTIKCPDGSAPTRPAGGPQAVPGNQAASPASQAPPANAAAPSWGTTAPPWGTPTSGNAAPAPASAAAPPWAAPPAGGSPQSTAPPWAR